MDWSFTLHFLLVIISVKLITLAPITIKSKKNDDIQKEEYIKINTNLNFQKPENLLKVHYSLVLQEEDNSAFPEELFEKPPVYLWSI